MRRGELIKTGDRRPFRPFEIHTADGARFLVQQPELILIVPDDDLVVVAEQGKGWDILDIPQITPLHIPSKPKPAKSSPR